MKTLLKTLYAFVLLASSAQLADVPQQSPVQGAVQAGQPTAAAVVQPPLPQQYPSFFGYWLVALKKTFDFSGRARRKELISAFSVNTVLQMLLSYVKEEWLVQDSDKHRFFRNWVISIISLVLMITDVSVTVRRFHDRNASGWWGLTIFPLIVNFFADGQPGPNQYGPDPKASQRMGYMAAPYPAPYPSQHARPMQPPAHYAPYAGPASNHPAAAHVHQGAPQTQTPQGAATTATTT